MFCLRPADNAASWFINGYMNVYMGKTHCPYKVSMMNTFSTYSSKE